MPLIEFILYSIIERDDKPGTKETGENEVKGEEEKVEKRGRKEKQRDRGRETERERER
jgi:hypothetical protein